MKTKLRDIFGAFWLPIYILVGVSWLLAPALGHEHYGVLRLISTEEAHGAGVWFRVCDVIAALLLLAAVLGFQVGRHARWFGKAIVAAAVLAAIDGLFPDTCYIGHSSCGVMAIGISGVHDVETIILTMLITTLSVADALRHRRAGSVGFITLQVAAAFLVVTGLASPQLRAVLQYAYEVALIIWLGWLVDRYNPVSPTLGRERVVRRVLGLWVVAGAIFSLVVAIPHVHFLAIWAAHNHTGNELLLEQHGIVIGVLMLYMARHVLRGERPALLLATVLFYTQLIKYAVLTPQPIGLIVYAVLLALLVYTRHGFDRNTQPPSWLSRFGDIAVVLGGVVVACIVLLGVITLSGQRERFLHDSSAVFGRPLHALDTREARLSERREARLRDLLVTLSVSIGAVAVWSLFQPKQARRHQEYHLTHGQFESLLRHYATSSEDFFKLWPHDKAYFCPPGLTGAVAYRVENGVAGVLADPIAPSEREREQLLRAFIAFAREHGWVVCVLVIGTASPKLYERVGLQVRQIGSSAVIDVGQFSAETVGEKWWRWQRNRAAKKGWNYETLLPPHDGLTLQALRAVSDAWLHEGRKTEQGFALGYYDEEYLQRCVIHVLRDESGRIVAFANELPLFGGVRQASVDLIRHLPEADGAMPALLMHIITSFEVSPTSTFDLGFVPLAGLDGELAKLVRRFGRSRFSAAGLEQFKNKFDPTWHSDYIAYDGDLIDLARIATSLERLLRVDKSVQKEVE